MRAKGCIAATNAQAANFSIASKDVIPAGAERSQDRLQHPMDMGDLLSAAERAKATRNGGTTCVIAPDWQPTPENIQALPEPLRRYIMLLHTRCDPAGDIQEIWSLSQQVIALTRWAQEQRALSPPSDQQACRHEAGSEAKKR